MREQINSLTLQAGQTPYITPLLQIPIPNLGLTDDKPQRKASTEPSMKK